jgi:hypothetical protein
MAKDHEKETKPDEELNEAYESLDCFNPFVLHDIEMMCTNYGLQGGFEEHLDSLNLKELQTLTLEMHAVIGNIGDWFEDLTMSKLWQGLQELMVADVQSTDAYPGNRYESD